MEDQKKERLEQEKKQKATSPFELPKKVYLGHMEFTVQETDRLNKASNEIISTSSGNLYEIIIQADMHPAKRRAELFRHVHNNLTGIGFRDLTGPGDSALAHAVYEVLRSNEALSREEGVLELADIGLWVYGERWSIELMPAHWRNSGHMNSVELGIQINSSLPEGEQWETMWHEMYHTLCMYLGIKDTESDSTAMAHLLCNFLADNDMSWMYVDLTEVSRVLVAHEGCRPKKTLERRLSPMQERDL
jgi:hypothetical protein